MMENLYGSFTAEQMESIKEKYHKRVHWLLVYVEEGYDKRKLDAYFRSVLLQVSGLSELLHSPSEMVDLMSNLQAAKSLIQSEDYRFSDYRKLILDSHRLVDECFRGGVADEPIKN